MGRSALAVARTRTQLIADLAARCQRVVDWSDEGDIVKEVQSGPGSRVKV